MKKKSLAKRIVSFITAVGLSLTSTVMLIPASAEDNAVTAGSACAQCTEAGTENPGTYSVWLDSEGTHKLVCSADNSHESGVSHTDGAGTSQAVHRVSALMLMQLKKTIFPMKL